MSLAQHYRSQLIAKQQGRLRICLLVALVGHLGVLAAGALYGKQISLTSTPEVDPSKLVPVEVIDLEPSNPQLTETDTPFRASIDTIAGGVHQPDLLEGIEVTAHAGDGETAREASAASSPVPSLSYAQPVTPSSNGLTVMAQLAAPWSATAAQAWAMATQLPERMEQRLGRILNPNRTAAGTLGIDAVGDQLWGEYDTALRRSIYQRWQRVEVNQKLEVKVRFRIDRQGGLSNLQLLQPSGHSAADQAALEAVRSAAPFAPLPKAAPQDSLQVDFTFAYFASKF
ncbi:MAG: hypothetical protein Kow00121_49990 [Elainellaceae cyanobacterium]